MMESPLGPGMRALAGLLESRTGQTLSEGRRWRLETSLRPVLKAHKLANLDGLAAAIMADQNGPLAQAAVDALLNNETCFFRDAHMFRMVANDLFPALMTAERRGKEAKTLHLWCAGCSTGQEVYSLAMLFQNHQDRWPGWRLRILATDISTEAIGRARSGLFLQSEVQRGLPINDLLRWFEPDGEQWRIHQTLRDMIDFRVENLFDDISPRGPYGIAFCRNVLLYFSTERKDRLLHILSRHLVGGGHLLLGAGETVIGQRSEFVASHRFRGAYERAGPPPPGPIL
ncbi:MAG: protein-glutamate O-methyltransferase CheR [Sphingobium sp.]